MAQDELTVALNALKDEHGRADLDKARAVLLAHREEASLRLIAAIRGGGATSAMLVALGTVSTAEGRTLLAAALHEGDLAWRISAAEGLAADPDPAASTALTAGLADADALTASAAASGIATRGGDAACASLRAGWSHPDGGVRAAVLSSLNRLACVTTEDRARAATDPDARVRALGIPANGR